jgi:hypothetical protein
MNIYYYNQKQEVVVPRGLTEQFAQDVEREAEKMMKGE